LVFGEREGFFIRSVGKNKRFIIDWVTYLSNFKPKVTSVTFRFQGCFYLWFFDELQIDGIPIKSMKKFIPILDWLPNYKKTNLSGDITAGLTVGVMLIPQGMAYAMLAGLPPIYGLYAATIPLIIYAIFGTSRQLAVGPVAMVSILISTGVGALVEVGSDSFIGMAILLSLMVGVFQLLMGLFRMGFLVNFLSHPVISGFTSAVAIYIAFSQFKHVLGLDLPRGKVHETIYHVFQQFKQINYYSLAVGLGALAIIVLLRKWNRKIPFPLIIVIIGLLAGRFLGLNDAPYNVAVVMNVPQGLPAFQMPVVDWQVISDLLPIALTITFIGFTESIAVAKHIQNKHKNYEIDANQELVALGLTNVFGSFFQAFPTQGGFGRSAVNDQSGAKTGLAAIISAVVVILTLLFLTSFFDFLPKAVLAAIIIVAVFGLIDIKEAKHLWKTDKRDFAMFMITAIATLVLGVEIGIGVGIAVSIIGLLIHVSYPHIAELGKDAQSNTFLNVDRFEHISAEEDVLIVRVDARLFFANTRFFQDRMKELEARKPNLKTVIVDGRGINGLDSTAIHALKDMVEDYKSRGITFMMTHVKGPVRDSLLRSKMRAVIGSQNFFLTIQDALDFYHGKAENDHSNLTLQSNVDPDS
jgi:SulP family sulfate permease